MNPEFWGSSKFVWQWCFVNKKFVFHELWALCSVITSYTCVTRSDEALVTGEQRVYKETLTITIFSLRSHLRTENWIQSQDMLLIIFLVFTTFLQSFKANENKNQLLTFDQQEERMSQFKLERHKEKSCKNPLVNKTYLECVENCFKNIFKGTSRACILWWMWKIYLWEDRKEEI